MRDNDITNSGRDFTISIILIGKMVKADTYTFKRLYRDDGTYYYHRISENQIQNNGEIYWKRCELTGSYDGIEKNPKMSLISVYWRDIILDIEDKHADISEVDRFKLVSVKQEDGAETHRNSVHQRDILEEFHCRYCILLNQPPQSPVTNVKDVRLFTM